MKRYNKGFTLIELLVVIAIIGILASVVLVSLNSARSKGVDVKVISDIQQIRTALESGYNGTGYPDLSNATGNQYGGFSSSPSDAITTLISDLQAQTSAVNVVTTPSTGSPVTGYALYGRLVSTTTAYFCMDSHGNTNQNTSVNTGATCPQ